jgi:hypothetical protein
MTGHFLSLVFIMLVVAASGVINYFNLGPNIVARKRPTLALHYVRCIYDVPWALHSLDIWQHLYNRLRAQPGRPPELCCYMCRSSHCAQILPRQRIQQCP